LGRGSLWSRRRWRRSQDRRETGGGEAGRFAYANHNGILVVRNGELGIASVEEQACLGAGGAFDFEIGSVIDGHGGRFATRTLYCRMPGGHYRRYVAQGREIVSVAANVDPARE
jgi:hypothetical protein